MKTRSLRCFWFFAVFLSLTSGATATELHVVLSVGERTDRPAPVQHEVTTATLSVVGASHPKAPVLFRESIALPTSPGAVIEKTLDVPPGRWRLELDGDGLWSAPATVEIGDTPVRHAATMWPTGPVGGVFRASPSLAIDGRLPPLPAFARFDFRPPPDAGSAPGPRGHVRCPILEGRIDCAVPVGKHDVRLVVEGFGRAYRWNVRVRQARPTDLGTVTLGPATGIIGWVTLADGGGAADVEVVVRPRLGRRPPPASPRPSTEILKHEATTDHRGFFQVGGLAPGAYTVEARSEGHAPTRSSVLVTVDQETVVADPPLLLHVAQSLSVYVDPPIPPEERGARWVAVFVQLDEGGTTLERLPPVSCTLAGLCLGEGLPVGPFRLRIEDAKGKQWSRETVVVDPGLANHSVTIPVISVRGTVTLGDEPLAASVFFGTANGGVELVSDREGAFEGPLPRPGAWRVEVRAQEAGVRRNLDDIDVRQDPATGYARVDIELPDTLMTGSVVNETGDPISGAIIDVHGFDQQWDGWTQQHAEKDGTFVLVGLPPGAYAVRANTVRKGKRLASSRVEVELEEAVEPAPLRLIVRADRLMRGRVVSHGVGVPGAQIRATSTGAMDRSIPNVTSDADGYFEVAMPSDVGDVIFGIGAPGFGYQITRRRYDSEATQIFEVAQTGGTVTVDWGGEGRRDDRIAVILRAGGLESVDYLRRTWARLHGGVPVADASPNRYVLPHLEPGGYQICLTEPRQLDLLARTGAPHAQCVGGQLTSGGELTLALVDSGGGARDP